MIKMLIVVDMQNDFITGALGTAEAQAIVPNVYNKIEEYVNAGFPVYFTRDTHYDDYLTTQEGKNLPVPHCIYGAYGHEVLETLFPPGFTVRDGETFIDKDSFGYDGWENFFYEFGDEPHEIELCGVCTDICVVSNALILKALLPETLITVDVRACAGTTPENHAAAIQVMKCCQVNIVGERDD